MPDEMENVLRNSLDAVDRGRRWAMLGITALFIATVISVGSLFALAASHLAASQQAGALKALFIASAAQMLLTACCAAIVMFHITRMTKAILRATESSGK